MRLLITRHGKAGDRQAWAASGKDDAIRPLTKKGRGEMKDAARALRRRFPRIDVLATSPLTRAVQTAKIVFKAYDDAPQFVELPLLSGGHAAGELLRWLVARDLDDGVVAVVGHEPDLSRWVAFLLTGKERAGLVKMRKGGVAVIEFLDGIAAGKGLLVSLT